MVGLNSGTSPKNSVLKKQYKKKRILTYTHKKNLKTFSTKY